MYIWHTSRMSDLAIKLWLEQASMSGTNVSTQKKILRYVTIRLKWKPAFSRHCLLLCKTDENNSKLPKPLENNGK